MELEKDFSVILVLKYPKLNVLQNILSLARSFANDLVSEFKAALELLYPGLFSKPYIDAILEMFIIFPPDLMCENNFEFK